MAANCFAKGFSAQFCCKNNNRNGNGKTQNGTQQGTLIGLK
jgi:hypothetical protein